MIPFFRKIRKKIVAGNPAESGADDNKPLKYMRYAIGEIVLVVIGILMALQINNWNEERKAKEKMDRLRLKFFFCYYFSFLSTKYISISPLPLASIFPLDLKLNSGSSFSNV